MNKLGGALALAGLGLSISSGPAIAECKFAKMLELPVTMKGLRPMVPAKINGAEVMLLADSGDFWSNLTPAIVAAHKLPPNYKYMGIMMSGAGGSRTASVVTVKTFSLGGAVLHDVDFVVAGSFGGDEAGLLGQNVFRADAVEYDLSGGAIRLLSEHDCAKANLAYWSGDKPVSVMDIQASDAINPHTTGVANVNGAKINVIFDTGAATSVMTLAAAARAGVKPGDPNVSSPGLSHGIGPRPFNYWVGRFANFKIGNEEIRNTQLEFGTLELPGADMLLGADLFLSHRVYVSNRLHKLFFTYQGGPVFKLNAKPLIQDGPDQAPKAYQPEPVSNPDPTDAEGFSRRGAVRATHREYGAAIADFTQAIGLAPLEAKYPLQRAQANIAAGHLDLALTDLDFSLKLKPNNIEALVWRALLYHKRAEPSAALVDIETAALLAPKAADIRLYLADAYSNLDKLEAALTQYDQWISSHHEDGGMAEALNSRCWTIPLKNPTPGQLGGGSG